MMFRLLLAVLIAATAAAGQFSFTSFETALVRPLALSADGHRLLVANAPGGLLEVYSLVNADRPVLVQSIPVGLEPVTVSPRTADEVWVVNNLSDDVSVVSLSAGRVVATLRCGDEPCDVVFAGGKAFVSISAEDTVEVYDETSLAALGTVPIFGKDPRRLAVNAAGTHVLALVHRSGNRTTIVPVDDAPSPPSPTNPSLPTAPDQGLIISLDDPAQAALVDHDLPDHDLVEIDVSTHAISRNFTGIGTILFDMTVDPATGHVYVANFESRNAVRFETALRGHAIDSRVTRVTTGVTPAVTPWDLNPGVDYNLLPNAAALATALAEPTNIVLDSGQGVLYVAAQGTDRIGVVDLTGTIVDRIEVGDTPGALVNTPTKRGPRGLAFDPVRQRLWVLNRLSHTLVTIDTQTRAVLSERALGYDPTPSWVADGRNFLYDAKLSGNGTMSCASCHVDADVDLLSWDLGDPGGQLAPIPPQPFPANLGMPSDFHPMKGPMLTQSLRGLTNEQPFHWRGDRDTLADFNGAFDTLMGGSLLSTSDMALYSIFLESTVYPPNPNRHLDDTLESSPSNSNAADGELEFFTPAVGSGSLGLACVTCHNTLAGSSSLIIGPTIIEEPQPMNVPHLRNAYRRTGAFFGSGDSKTGFGFVHDGSVDTLINFLDLSPFDPWPQNKKDDMALFVLAFDTGTKPIVGYQVSVDSSNASTGGVGADIALLESRAAAGDADLVAKGTIDGARRGVLYDANTGLYSADDPNLGPWSWTALKNLAAAGQAALTFTAVPPGSGTRIGIDRDLDGQLDAVDGQEPYGPSTHPEVTLQASTEPQVGEDDFAIVAPNAGVGAGGYIGFSGQAASIVTPLGTALVDYTDPGFFALPMFADAAGDGIVAGAIPDIAALAGVQLYTQAALWRPDSTLILTNGLKITIQP